MVVVGMLEAREIRPWPSERTSQLSYRVRAEAGDAIRKESSELADALEAERQAREASDQDIIERLRDEALSKYPQECARSGTRERSRSRRGQKSGGCGHLPAPMWGATQTGVW